MRVPRLPSWLLLAACGAGGAYGCRVERELDPGDRVHPVGYADHESDVFHGHELERFGYAMEECRECHGDDYHGGRVGVSCTDAGCHTDGVEACDTCHAAIPTTGAHDAHLEQGLSCWDCHDEVKDARTPAHPSGEIEVVLSGLAAAGGREPRFELEAFTCNDVYCHGGREIGWDDGGPLDCTSCHEAPPGSHARFATSDGGCEGCHAGAATHLDGQFDLAELTCSTCHGEGPLGAPPAGLVTDPDGPGVGAHARHLDPTLLDRVGKVASCRDCHEVPELVADEGHLDAQAPADVVLRNGESYDPVARTCTVGCHWDLEPGPAWGDTSGAPRDCDGCHAMPPVMTRAGGPHPPSPGGATSCLGCHPIDPAIHVNGTVDFQW